MSKTENDLFATVTELPGNKAHEEQLKAIRTRYKWAAQHCIGKQTLELACGAGIGLGILDKVSKSVTGGDIDPGLLNYGLSHYTNRGIQFIQLDACNISLPSNSVDVVVCFEAIYYFPSFFQAVQEVARILTLKGEFVGCTVNKAWHGFNPSPHSVRYYELQELGKILDNAGFSTSFSLAYEDRPQGVSRFIAWLRSKAAQFGFIPKTMKGKEALKRLFYGPLSSIPAEIDTDGPVDAVIDYDQRLKLSDFKVIFFHAKKKPSKKLNTN